MAYSWLAIEAISFCVWVAMSRQLLVTIWLGVQLMLTYLLSLFFSSLLPFVDFDLDIVCFHPVFFLWVLCCHLGFGFCCDSWSIWYIRILIRWSLLFIFVWGIRFVSVIVCIIFCFYMFSSWGNFPLQSYWSLPCDHALHCSDELMWEQLC